MIGKYDIEINTKKINYKFTINRNITIIRGDSATGKSTLYSIIDLKNKGTSRVSVKCKVKCDVLDDRNWLYIIKKENNTIFFIDEESNFIYTKEFAREVSNGNGNYFVIITRDNLPYINYSYKEIYEIRNSGKYNLLVKVFNFEEDCYNESNLNVNSIYKVITEDSKSGYELLSEIYKDKIVESSEGKSKVLNLIDNNVLAVVDGSAFGNEIDRLLLNKSKYIVFLPESLEYLILKSNVFNTIKYIDDIENKIDSVEFCSYERYFTYILTKIASEYKYGIKYSKNNLDNFLKIKKNINKIIEELPICIRPKKLKEDQSHLKWD